MDQNVRESAEFQMHTRSGSTERNQTQELEPTPVKHSDESDRSNRDLSGALDHPEGVYVNKDPKESEMYSSGNMMVSISMMNNKMDSEKSTKNQHQLISGGDHAAVKDSAKHSYGQTDNFRFNRIRGDPKAKGISTPGNHYFSNSAYNLKTVESTPIDKVFPGLSKLSQPHLDVSANGTGVILVTVPDGLLKGRKQSMKRSSIANTTSHKDLTRKTSFIPEIGQVPPQLAKMQNASYDRLATVKVQNMQLVPNKDLESHLGSSNGHQTTTMLTVAGPAANINDLKIKHNKKVPVYKNDDVKRPQPRIAHVNIDMRTSNIELDQLSQTKYPAGALSGSERATPLINNTNTKSTKRLYVPVSATKDALDINGTKKKTLSQKGFLGIQSHFIAPTVQHKFLPSLHSKSVEALKKQKQQQRSWNRRNNPLSGVPLTTSAMTSNSTQLLVSPSERKSTKYKVVIGGGLQVRELVSKHQIKADEMMQSKIREKQTSELLSKFAEAEVEPFDLTRPSDKPNKKLSLGLANCEPDVNGLTYSLSTEGKDRGALKSVIETIRAEDQSSRQLSQMRAEVMQTLSHMEKMAGSRSASTDEDAMPKLSIQKYAQQLTANNQLQKELTQQEMLEQQDQIQLQNIVNGMFKQSTAQKKPDELTRNIFHYKTETINKNNQAATRAIFKLEHANFLQGQSRKQSQESLKKPEERNKIEQIYHSGSQHFQSSKLQPGVYRTYQEAPSEQARALLKILESKKKMRRRDRNHQLMVQTNSSHSHESSILAGQSTDRSASEVRLLPHDNNSMPTHRREIVLQQQGAREISRSPRSIINPRIILTHDRSQELMIHEQDQEELIEQRRGTKETLPLSVDGVSASPGGKSGRTPLSKAETSNNKRSWRKKLSHKEQEESSLKEGSQLKEYGTQTSEEQAIDYSAEEKMHADYSKTMTDQRYRGSESMKLLLEPTKVIDIVPISEEVRGISPKKVVPGIHQMVMEGINDIKRFSQDSMIERSQSEKSRTIEMTTEEKIEATQTPNQLTTNQQSIVSPDQSMLMSELRKNRNANETIVQTEIGTPGKRVGIVPRRCQGGSVLATDKSTDQPSESVISPLKIQPKMQQIEISTGLSGSLTNVDLRKYLPTNNNSSAENSVERAAPLRIKKNKKPRVAEKMQVELQKQSVQSVEKHPKSISLAREMNNTTGHSVSTRNFELQISLEHENMQKRIHNYQQNMLKKQKKKGRILESDLALIKRNMTSESLERLINPDKVIVPSFLRKRSIHDNSAESIRERRLSAVQALDVKSFEAEMDQIVNQLNTTKSNNDLTTIESAAVEALNETAVGGSIEKNNVSLPKINSNLNDLSVISSAAERNLPPLSRLTITADIKKTPILQNLKKRVSNQLTISGPYHSSKYISNHKVFKQGIRQNPSLKTSKNSSLAPISGHTSLSPLRERHQLRNGLDVLQIRMPKKREELLSMLQQHESGGLFFQANSNKVDQSTGPTPNVDIKSQASLKHSLKGIYDAGQDFLDGTAGEDLTARAMQSLEASRQRSLQERSRADKQRKKDTQLTTLYQAWSQKSLKSVMSKTPLRGAKGEPDVYGALKLQQRELDRRISHHNSSFQGGAPSTSNDKSENPGQAYDTYNLLKKANPRVLINRNNHPMVISSDVHSTHEYEISMTGDDSVKNKKQSLGMVSSVFGKSGMQSVRKSLINQKVQ